MSFLTPAQTSFLQTVNTDILADHLADKRSANTKRAYAKSLRDFFVFASGEDPNPKLVGEFLSLDRSSAIALVLSYKGHLISRNLSEATVNSRLAAIKSLVSHAQKVGKCQWSLEEVRGEKVKAYRDTTGIDQDAFKKILSLPDRSTQKGKRDYALLLLLWSNVPRRDEIVKTDIGDFDPDTRTLSILGKGRGTQRELISLSGSTVEAIADWLKTRHNLIDTDPLFVGLSNVSRGRRLTGDGLSHIVEALSAESGLTKRFTPHRCRHSGITAALEATGGDVRKVQKLSRHSSLQTLLIYDDARSNTQGEVTDLLSDLIG
jgi:integrase/recombinase XerC